MTNDTLNKAVSLNKKRESLNNKLNYLDTCYKIEFYTRSGTILVNKDKTAELFYLLRSVLKNQYKEKLSIIQFQIEEL